MLHAVKLWSYWLVLLTRCILRLACAALCCLITAGCINTGALYSDLSAREELADLPGEWSSAFVAGSIATSWLADLQDRSLVMLAEEVLANNLALRSLAAQVGQSYAQADVASGGRLPNLDAALNARRSAANSQLFPDNYVYNNAFDASLRFSWNPDLWGELSAQARSASYTLEAALAGYQRQRNTHIATLASDWGALVVCRQFVLLDNQRVKRAEELLEAANQSYTLGLESLLAVRNQEIVLAREKRTLTTQKRQCRDLERNLALMLGALPGKTVQVPGRLPPLPPVPAAGVPSDLLKNRSDIIEAQRRLKASYENIAGARAARFPSLSISASATRNNDELWPLFSDPVNTFSLAASLAIPLYAFGRLEAQEEVQRQGVIQAEVHYIQAIYTAIKEVEELLDAEYSLAESARLAEESFTLTSDSAAIAEQQYITGTSDFDSWVNAEIARFNSQATLLELAREHWQTRVRLHLALGSSPLAVHSATDRQHTDSDTHKLQPGSDLREPL